MDEQHRQSKAGRERLPPTPPLPPQAAAATATAWRALVATSHAHVLPKHSGTGGALLAHVQDLNKETGERDAQLLGKEGRREGSREGGRERTPQTARLLTINFQFLIQ